MHANQTYPHYSPSWVGGLMDPVFLRHAVNDAEGECHADSTAARLPWLGWRAAARTIVALFQQRSNGR